MVEKAVWYYKKEDKKQGPVSYETLQEMLDHGEIELSTKIWKATLEEWITISEINHYNFTSLDETPTVEINKQVTYTRETEQTLVRPRPWIRFWARMIDYSLFYFFICLLNNYFLSLTFSPKALFPMFILFIWIFIETVLITTWGTTPGKWLLRITVRDEFHQKLTFSHALNRSLSLWWLGLAAGIPIISFVTLLVAAFKLTKKGITSWDERNNYQIFHEKIGGRRCIIVILYFIFLIWLSTFPQFNMMQFYG